MKTRLLESPARRIPIALAAGTALVLVAAGVYLFFGEPSARPVNPQKIIAAAQAYTRALRQNHATVPHSVPLQTLIDQGLLQPGDVGSFQGLDAKIYLTSSGNGEPDVLMTVRLPDGTDVVLLANGTSRRVKP